MYLWMSHSISISKSCGGGCRKVIKCVWLLCEKWFHNHCNLSVVIVIMYLRPWSYM